MKKQKTLRALLATLLLVVMLVINVPVFAATPTGSITLTKMESGATITVYKIADFNVDADGQPTYPTYRWVAGVDSWMQTNYPAYKNTDTEGARGFENAADKEAVYGAITAAIRTADSGLSLSALTDVSIADGGEKEKVISNLSVGTYLVVIEGADRIYQPIVRNVGLKTGTSGWEIDTAYLNVDAEAKSAPVSITKTVNDNDVNTAEEVTYTILADVPKYPDGAISQKFVISDKLPSSMSLKAGSIVVTKIAQDDSETAMTEGSGYTSVADAAKTFALDFTYSAIKGAKSIKVVYNASLNPDATTTIYGSNLNEAFLDYSNDPYVASSSKTVELTEKPDVKTYGFNIQKTNGTSNLPGAEFKVYQNEADTAALKFTAVAGETGVYYYDPNGTVEVLQGNTDGKIEVRGLDSGTYYVEETKAPSKADGADADYNKLPGKTAVVVGTNSVETKEIRNKTGFQLPVTGGMGTVIFTVAGIAFIVVGAAIVISKKRGSKN